MSEPGRERAVEFKGLWGRVRSQLDSAVPLVLGSVDEASPSAQESEGLGGR